MLSISENHNYLETMYPVWFHSTTRVNLAQAKVNELVQIPLKRPLYVNLEGQRIGTTINDIA